MNPKRENSPQIHADSNADLRGYNKGKVKKSARVKRAILHWLRLKGRWKNRIPTVDNQAN